MLVLLAVIVVDVRGDQPIAHRVKGNLHGRVHMRVTRVQAESEVVQMRIHNEMLERGGCADLIRRVFEGNCDATGLRKDGENLKRGERGIELALVGRITAMSNVLNKIAEGDALGDIECALYFVHGIEPADPLGIGNRDWDAAFAARSQVALGRRVQRVKLQMVFAKRVRELPNLLLVAVVEMARGAKDLDCVDFRATNFRQQPRGQGLVDVAVSREDAAHYGLATGELWNC